MMKYSARASVAIILLIVAAAPAFCEEIVYQKWAKSGVAFKVGDFRFTPKWNDPDLLLTIDDDYLVVPKEDCRSYSPMRICFNDTRYVRGGTVLPDDIHATDLTTEMFITVYGKTALLTLTRTFSKTVFVVGEEARVSAIIENTGELDAASVKYSDDIPSAFEVADVKGCTQVRDGVQWNGTLRKGSRLQCIYTIRAVSDKRVNTKALVEYWDGIADKSKTVTQLLDVKKNPLEIEIGLPSAKMTLGDSFKANVTVKNMHNESIRIEAMTLWAQGVTDGSEKSLFKGELLSKENRSFVVDYEASHTGDHNMTVQSTYLVNSVVQETRLFRKLIIVSDLTIDLVPTIPPVEAGGHADIEMQAINPGTKELRDVTVRVDSDVPGFETIFRSADVLLKQNSLTLPFRVSPNSSGTYKLNASATYKSAYGEEFLFAKDFKIVVAAPAGTAPIEATPVPIPEVEKPVKPQKPTLPDVGLLSESSTRSGGLVLVGAVVISALLLFLFKFKVRHDS